jgi:hypothetical protein
MGIANQVMPLIEQCLAEAPVKQGIRMAELGSQFMNVSDVFKGPAKAYFEARGIQHDSFDLDGQFDAVVLDLGEPLPPGSPYLNVYNVLTNFGTTEHVVNHFTCYQNIHRMCAPGAVMLHAVPAPGNWHNHGRYYYPQTFYASLAAANDYEVVLLEGIAHHKRAQRELTCAILRKRSDGEFMAEADFAALPITVDEDNRFVDAFLPRRNFAGRIKRIGTRLFGDEKHKL